MKIFLIFLMIFSLTACTLLPLPDGGASRLLDDGVVVWGKLETGHNWSVRFVDDEAGVVCYTFNYKDIDCLPISETKLERE
jgi:hypothetical protein